MQIGSHSYTATVHFNFGQSFVDMLSCIQTLSGPHSSGVTRLLTIPGPIGS